MSEHLKISVRFHDEEMVMLRAELASAAFKGQTEAWSAWPAAKPRCRWNAC